MAAKMDVIDRVEIDAWRGLRRGRWQDRVNVRDFIQCNYTPYGSDANFLAGAEPPSKDLANRVREQFRARGLTTY